MADILVVDDESSIRETLVEILEYENYKVAQAADGLEALNYLKINKVDVVLCDIKMPKMDGMQLLEWAQTEGIDAAFIMISAQGTIETAVAATKIGAFDFIQKPPDLNRMLLTIRNAIDKENLIKETRTLKRRISKTSEIIGNSKIIMEVKGTIEKVAPTDARVLIIGENGTGKELVAKWIHEKSNRSKKNLIEVNCAAIPSELIESELFGHEKGSFTSAHKQRIGKFEQAHLGTIFLDEIGDMSLTAQAKVLRALQENKITRVGGEKSISINVRVLAATNKNLKEEIALGNFREDLYHRLSVIIIDVPPLRSRNKDIEELTYYFLNEICAEYGISLKKISTEVLNRINGYNWPGNIRELRNIIERLIILSDKEITTKEVSLYTNL
ncbi:MAG: sigma-54-dependent Fis family transcriptional regulator [Flammeovirgaceae bacterium]|jgi:two-component system, NtrC family, nitrogen regulation response regulator NtrX|nr:sigma-54-dependent Fis family transcriptional regulator [Flammeovirgaceae bacterium]|tara:strand:- start:18719 stop:19876 length:1158 start_codon:yes stop_codon:yes gene_type:complete